jgi:hypothetical protein
MAEVKLLRSRRNVCARPPHVSNGRAFMQVVSYRTPERTEILGA